MLRYLLHKECNISICISPPSWILIFSLTPITKLVLNKKCENSRHCCISRQRQEADSR